jgi:hypothetical protein
MGSITFSVVAAQNSEECKKSTDEKQKAKIWF